MGFFPVDDRTIDYLKLSGREDALIETVELYCREQGLWRDDTQMAAYSEVLELDMTAIEPALAGPKRPQDRIVLGDMKTRIWTLCAPGDRLIKVLMRLATIFFSGVSG